MGPIEVRAKLSPSAAACGLVPVHLDALLVAALGKRNGARAITRRTPASKLRQLVAPGLLMVDTAEDSCHAATAGLVGSGGSTVVWRAYGKRREVVRALKLIHELTIEGDAHDVEWVVEPAAHDLVDCFVADGVSQRHMPLSWTPGALLLDEGAHEGPYWHPARQHELAALGSPVKLGRSVRDLLSRLDIEFTTAASKQQPTRMLAMPRLERLLRQRDGGSGPGPGTSAYFEGKRSDKRVIPAVAETTKSMFDNGKSDEDIGEELGCSVRTVKRIRTAMGLKRARAPGPMVNSSQLRELHRAGLSTLEISRRMGCTYRTAQEHMSRLGLEAHATHTRSALVTIRLDPADLERLQAAAVAAGTSVEDWIVTTSLEAATK